MLALLLRLLGGRDIFGCLVVGQRDLLDDRIGTCLNPAAIVVLLEARDDCVANDQA